MELIPIDELLDYLSPVATVFCVWGHIWHVQELPPPGCGLSDAHRGQQGWELNPVLLHVEYRL